MIKGLYAAASGMTTMQQRQDIISNNIANSGTPGFRRSTPVQGGFHDMFSKSLRSGSYFQGRTPGGGLRSVESFTDPRAGTIAATGNPLNMALSGPGFFVVQGADGERFTRNGQFGLDAQGDLSTGAGEKVLDIGGNPIRVDGGPVEVAEDGTVVVGGQAVGQLRIVEFEDPRGLMRQGESLYTASEEMINASAAGVETRVQQGHLEQSNVAVSSEVMNMMMGMRGYEANQRVIQTIDQSIGRLIDQVGMPS